MTDCRDSWTCREAVGELMSPPQVVAFDQSVSRMEAAKRFAERLQDAAILQGGMEPADFDGVCQVIEVQIGTEEWWRVIVRCRLVRTFEGVECPGRAESGEHDAT